MSVNRLPGPLRAFLLGVNLLGPSLAISTFARDPVALSLPLLVIAVMAMVAAPHTVTIGARMEMSTFHPFILTALLLLGPAEAHFTAVAAVISMAVFPRRRWEGYRFFFNLNGMLIATWVTCRLYSLCGGGGPLSLDRDLPALLAATLGFFLVNTLLVSGAVGFSTGTSVGRVWQEKYLWSAPSYFGGAALAMLLALMVIRFGIYSLLLCLPLSALLYYSYRLYVEKMEEKQRHMDDIQRMNRDLERKVRERTDELEILNQKLKESNAELIRANNLKSEFLANMSHELRTPLNAIIGFSELLMEQGPHPLLGDKRDYVGDILSSGRHLLELINDILDLSKIEAGKMRLCLDEIDLGEIVEEAMMTLKVDASRKEIRLEASLDGSVAGVVADRGKIKQILTNLLSNAVKFTPAGGRVQLSAARKEGFLEVSVEDTGIGIRPEDHERIFAAFTQVDGSYARKYQGTGLGLTLVKRFVEMHGGEISIQSAVGKGSVFTFRIPLAPVGSRQAAGPRVPPESGKAPAKSAVGSGQLILIVEDNPGNMKLAREILTARGYRVLEAASGEEALDTIRFIRPDLILMDIQLPGLDGLAVTRRIQSSPDTRAIPIVALTAHVMMGHEASALEAGCVGYIPKPIDATGFPHQVAEILAQFPPDESARTSGKEGS
ncbi:MAG: ATP-binding protein [Acidobacteria bacterium]|nr:ATP-binding protein [Acidobacteriota bacterium]